MSKNEPRVESVHRALVLVTVLLREGSISVTEAAMLLDVNASTAYRLLSTLVADEFAAQRDGRRYQLGPALGGVRPLERVPSVDPAFRFGLEALHRRTRETVHVATLLGTQVRYIEGIEASEGGLRFSLRVGAAMPAHLSAGGKALLADLSDAEVEARYSMAGSGRRGRRDEVDLPTLRQQLAQVRDERVAWNFEESEAGVVGMAIAVGERGVSRAALSIGVPAARYTRAAGLRWSDDLTDIAEVIARMRRG